MPIKISPRMSLINLTEIINIVMVSNRMYDVQCTRTVYAVHCTSTRRTVSAVQYSVRLVDFTVWRTVAIMIGVRFHLFDVLIRNAYFTEKQSYCLCH